MENIRFEFDAAKPVKFLETMGDGEYDVELQAFVAGAITVGDYDAGKYGGAGEMTGTVKEMMPEIIEKSLVKLLPFTFMANDSKERLGSAAAEELSSRGITASVEITRFSPTWDSFQKFRDERKKYIEFKAANPDMTDRPCFNPGMFKPGNVPAGAPGLNPFLSALTPDKFCRSCGTKRGEGERFCKNCGAAFKG